jgi:Vitamin B12 dependent methionine synthase, activation domain
MNSPTAPGPTVGGDPEARIIDPLPIEVARPMVLMRLGYRRPSQVPEKTSRIIDGVIEQARSLLAPKAIYRVVDVGQAEPGVIVIGGAIRSNSVSVNERLRDCRRAVIFAATVGPGVEAWGHNLMNSGELTRALLADAYASSAAIALGLEVETIAARCLAEERLEATKRYAPGYGDWELADQAPLLGLLDATRIGIALTEEYLMIPAKSISGVIGGR